MKWRVVAIAVGLIIPIAVDYLFFPPDSLRSRARREWKDVSIQRLQLTLSDRATLQRRVESLCRDLQQSQGIGSQWINDDLLVMKNGEWMLCENICQKQDYRIQDICIGHGSDGKWYYSTFNFGIENFRLRTGRQPESLTQFIQRYWMVPFDGTSDDCLRSTWDGSAVWGYDKASSTMSTP